MDSSWHVTLVLVVLVVTSGYTANSARPGGRFARGVIDPKTDVVNNDKQVELLKLQLYNALEEQHQNFLEIKNLTNELDSALQQVEYLSQKEELLNKTLERLSLENEDLKRQLREKDEKVQTMGRKLNETLRNQKESSDPDVYLNNTLKDFYHDRDWRALRRGLESQLDEYSNAYRQLMTISYGHGYPLWKIGSYCMVDLAAVLSSGPLGGNIAESDNDTMLHGAAEGGCLPVAKMMLDRGADIEARDNGGATPLVIASRYGQLEIVHMLKEKGANVNATDFKRESCLHLAAQGGHLEVVKFLLNAGAQVSAVDDEGHTPLYLARSRGRNNVVEYLTHLRSSRQLR